ncbi:polysaccharide biosynthesis protein [Virgifigura deserti]|uniref:polysaccharide biosynthesis protein n=1 Tax=Virgifigura deserti TaxID=2268457 RepID=UPI003CCC094D
MRRPTLLTKRAACAYIHDLMMVGIGFVAAMYLRVGSLLFGPYLDATLASLPLILAIGAVTLPTLRLYRGIWRYASINDLIQLTKAVTAVIVVFLLVLFLVNRLDPIPRSVPVIQWFITLVLMGGTRFAYRLRKDRRLALSLAATGEKRTPIVLVGTSDAMDLFLRSLAKTPSCPYRAVGIIAVKPAHVGRTLQGVPVIASLDGLEEAIEKLQRSGDRPHRIVVAQDDAKIHGPTMRRLVETCGRLGLPISRMSRPTEFREMARSGHIELQPIAIEDLLGRPQMALDLTAIRELVAGRRVLVTGAGGTIGSELSRQIAALAPDRLVLLDNSEFNLYAIDLEVQQTHPATPLSTVFCDVRDRQRISTVFAKHRPEFVFHAAALKHVPVVEANPCEGVLTNVVGTRNVADAAAATGTIAMVLISTDKAVRPTSVMGATKRIAEAYCQALDVRGERSGTRLMTVRFGNVLGSSGSVVPLFRQQLARGGPITITHPEMKRYFMTVREAVELVLQASAYGLTRPDDRGRVLILDMGEPVRIVDLARQMIRLAGLNPERDVTIRYTGLRPGEKLIEELFDPAEMPSPTEAAGVFCGSPAVFDGTTITRMIDDLEAAARAGDAEQVTMIHRRAVPDYAAAATETWLPPAKLAHEMDHEMDRRAAR